MKTRITEMLGIEVPICAFSHCRDVVVEVSKAGGIGILGVSGHSIERVEQELQWIDAHIGGKPYGVDLLIPQTYQNVSAQKLDLERVIPDRHRAFVRELCDRAGLPPLPQLEASQLLHDAMREINMTPEEGDSLLEVALRHPVKLVVNALGAPPAGKVRALQARGIKVGSLVGKAEHAAAQVAAGVDLLVAQGMEAGGHTGSITSMVLWPQIVDLVAPLPVLAAGGIGRGRQMAAALAMGAEGIWCGSIWLGTRQSELDPDMKGRLFAARSEDAIQTRALTGKPCRALKSHYTDAWEQAGAPQPLPMPIQTLLWTEPRLRAQRARAAQWMTYPVGQIVGDMLEETTVREVVYGLLEEFLQSVERLQSITFGE
jgi:NAD(P)H-dependent flavin oxidoreductase YrpB (nitropropane dioxygenase family)